MNSKVQILKLVHVVTLLTVSSIEDMFIDNWAFK